MANSASKKTGERKPHVSWTNDLNDNGKSSYYTILDWMLEGDNYERWVGKKPDVGKAESKTKIYQEINRVLVSTGHIQREYNEISQFILSIKENFNAAKKQVCATGSSIYPHSADAAKDVKESANLKCPRYYELAKIYQTRPEFTQAGVAENGSAALSIEELLNSVDCDSISIASSVDDEVEETAASYYLQVPTPTLPPSLLSVRPLPEISRLKGRFKILTTKGGKCRASSKRDFVKIISGYFDTRSKDIKTRGERRAKKLEAKLAKQKLEMDMERYKMRMQMADKLHLMSPDSELYKSLFEDFNRLGQQ